MKTKSEVQETKKAGRPPEGTAIPTETAKPEKAPGRRRGRPKTTETREPAAGLSTDPAGAAGNAKAAESQILTDMPPVVPKDSAENAGNTESQAPADTPPVTAAEAAGNAKTTKSQACADTPPIVPTDGAENAGASGTALAAVPSRIEPLTREQLRMEYRKRTGIIKDQLKSIQQSFLVIAFQLYWIKENAMYPSAYKNIYEFADVEYGISRTTCGNLIYIVDTYGERDGDGRVLENLQERYRNFSASQLIAMAGMPVEVREKVKPDMSVRMINRMRKQEAQARLGSGREADTTQKDAAAAQEDAPATDPRTIPEQTGPAAETATGSAAAKDGREPQAPTDANTDGQYTGKDTPATAASPETAQGQDTGDSTTPGTATTQGVNDNPAAVTATTQGGDGSPAAGTATGQARNVPEGKGQPEPAGRPAPQENMKVYNTLLSFTSYSRFEKEQEYLRTLIKNVFDDSRGTVTVKVIYEKATA